MDNNILSVSQVNSYIKSLLDRDALLSEIYVRGEISNYKLYPSGHHYFSLKDQEGTIRCVLFKGSAYGLKFRPENGMKVIASGRVTVFPRDGQYQLYCSRLIPDGIGDLHVAFEQLKEKLLQEGMFDQSLKKPLPQFPHTIAIITSPAGAAIRDMLRIIGKRYPLARVVVLGVRVQGVEAPAEISGALRYVNRHRLADLIITGRGGGSIEDLWAFNDERVARAIFESEIPVVSAVGHEPDVTISDFVADLRAATPSNAAELVTPGMAELMARLGSAQAAMAQAVTRKVKLYREKLDGISSKRVLQSPVYYIQDKRILLDFSHKRLVSASQAIISEKKQAFIRLAASIDALSPLKVLARGYSIAEDSRGRILKSCDAVSAGDRVGIRLRDGNVICTVDGIEKNTD